MDLREISANHKLWGTHVLSKWWGAKPPFPAGFPSSPRFKSFFKRLSSLPWRSSWCFRLTQRRSLKLSGAHVTEFQAWRLDGEMNSGSLRRMSVNDPREDHCWRESWMGSFLQEPGGHSFTELNECLSRCFHLYYVSARTQRQALI